MKNMSLELIQVFFILCMLCESGGGDEPSHSTGFQLLPEELVVEVTNAYNKRPHTEGMTTNHVTEGTIEPKVDITIPDSQNRKLNKKYN